ncbi:hypothetical protein BKA70DRAFT_1272068 [Coprinopsis sp. MPI-PUGE-AT-0042]|nr:hypothetical protein BKA70DRAFT_1272068 [Coprinopsis sp. MPI-PUGE-AT-0042]
MASDWEGGQEMEEQDKGPAGQRLALGGRQGGVAAGEEGGISGAGRCAEERRFGGDAERCDTASSSKSTTKALLNLASGSHTQMLAYLRKHVYVIVAVV